jgi:TetR/AcrR family transcriptional regulator
MPNSHTAPPARRRGRPVKAESTDAAAAIRQAALRAFAQHGFHGVSVVEIAQAAGVAKPLVHYHFASKELLWQAAVAEAFEALRAQLQQFEHFLGGGSPLHAMRSAAIALVRFAAQHAELVRIVVDETGKGGERAQWLHSEYLLPGYQLGQRIVQGLSLHVPPGHRLPPPEHVVPAVLGIMNFAFLDAALVRSAFGVDVHSEAYITRHGELLAQALMGLMTPLPAV